MFAGIHNQFPSINYVLSENICSAFHKTLRKKPLRWLNRVMQDHEARASDLNRKLMFSFFLLFS